jgi:8-oxo-dGTP pyrophosphatase MutT (NUDIX family)
MSYSGAGFILLTTDFRILVIQDKKTKKWGFPKGHREESDTSDTHTAVRELQEETGLREETYIIHPQPFRIVRGSASYIFRYALLKPDVDPQSILIQASELSAYQWIPLCFFYIQPDFVDGNKYMRTWITDVVGGSTRKSNTILQEIIHGMWGESQGDVMEEDTEGVGVPFSPYLDETCRGC